MKSTTQLILATLILTTTLTQTPSITENPRYPKGFKLKKLASFNPGYAFDLKNADQETLEITSTKGQIINVPRTTKKNLPDDFKASTVLLFDTIESYLNIIAYNKKQKSCVIYIQWSESKNTLLNEKMNRNECNRARISRIKGGTKKLVSYITDDGKFHWLVKENESDTGSNFKTESTNLFTTGALLEKASHQVVVLGRDSYQDAYDQISIYQKSKTLDEKYPEKVIFFKSSSKDNNLSSSSTLTFNVYKYTILNMGKEDLSGHKVLNLKVQSDYKTSGNYFNMVMMNLKGSDGLYYRFIKGYALKAIQYNEKQAYSGKPLTSTISNFWGVLTHPGISGIHHSYFINDASLKICKPSSDNLDTSDKFEKIFHHDCITRSDKDLSIQPDEYVDSVSMRSDYITVVSIRSVGNLEDKRQVVVNINQSFLPSTIDTQNYDYSADRDVLYEIKRDFSSSEQPFVNGYYQDPTKGNKMIYLIENNPQVGETIELTAKDKSSEVKHVLEITFVDHFAKNSVSKSEVYVDVNTDQIGKVVTSPEKVKIQGDETTKIPDFNADSFFGFTPFMFESVSHLHNMDSLEEIKLRGEKQAPFNPLDVTLACELNDYYVFTKSSKLYSFAPRASGVHEKTFLQSSLTDLNIEVKDFECIGTMDNNLMIIGMKQKNTYAAIHFGEKGEYIVRRFYHPNDSILKVKRALFNKFGLRYYLKFDDEKEGTLRFKAVHPMFKIASSTQLTGSQDILGVTVKFDITVHQSTMVKEAVLE